MTTNVATTDISAASNTPAKNPTITTSNNAPTMPATPPDPSVSLSRECFFFFLPIALPALVLVPVRGVNRAALKAGFVGFLAIRVRHGVAPVARLYGRFSGPGASLFVLCYAGAESLAEPGELVAARYAAGFGTMGFRFGEWRL